MVILARALVVVIFAAGLSLVVLSLPGTVWSGVRPSPSATGGSLIAASFAGAVALSITRDWRGQRADQLEQQRQAAADALAAEQREQRASAYARIVAGIVQSFSGGSQNDLAVDRSTVALWASPATIRAVDAWQRAAFEIMRTNGGAVPLERRLEVQRLVAKVAVESRKDLGLGNDVSVDEVAALLFDDFPRT